MSINSIWSEFGNHRISLFSNRGRGGGVKKSLTEKKGMMYQTFFLLTPCQKPPQAKHRARLGPAFFGLAWPGFWPQARAGTSLLRMNEKWSFSPSWQCAWWEKCIFASFFLISLPRVFTVTTFHIIFHSLFHSLLFVPLPNTWKWPKNEIENEVKMATVNNPNTPSKLKFDTINDPSKVYYQQKS